MVSWNEVRETPGGSFWRENSKFGFEMPFLELFRHLMCASHHQYTSLKDVLYTLVWILFKTFRFIYSVSLWSGTHQIDLQFVYLMWDLFLYFVSNFSNVCFCFCRNQNAGDCCFQRKDHRVAEARRKHGKGAHTPHNGCVWDCAFTNGLQTHRRNQRYITQCIWTFFFPFETNCN